MCCSSLILKSLFSVQNFSVFKGGISSWVISLHKFFIYSLFLFLNVFLQLYCYIRFLLFVQILTIFIIVFVMILFIIFLSCILFLCSSISCKICSDHNNVSYTEIIWITLSMNAAREWEHHAVIHILENKHTLHTKMNINIETKMKVIKTVFFSMTKTDLNILTEF